MIKTLSFIALILLGIFIFIYGGYDDSPGAQLIGLLTVIWGIFLLIKKSKEAKKSN